MMDGQVAAIRAALDGAGPARSAILAYAAKYASSLYGPFRDAVDVTIAGGGDRRGYQQDPANRREALAEVRLDVAEGADIVMVKPALGYLDVVADVRAEVDVPGRRLPGRGGVRDDRCRRRAGLAGPPGGRPRDARLRSSGPVPTSSSPTSPARWPSGSRRAGRDRGRGR